MRFIILLLVTSLFLSASEEKKIVLATYFTEKEALQGLKNTANSFNDSFNQLQKKYLFELALLQSPKNYLLVLKPFENYDEATMILGEARKVYASAFISNYPRKLNTFVVSMPLKEPNSQTTLKPTPTAVIPDVPSEFSQPLSVEEIVTLSKPEKTAPVIQKAVEAKKVTPSTPMPSLFYFSYALLTLLVIIIAAMAWNNKKLTYRLKENEMLHSHSDDDEEHLLTPVDIDIITLSRYVQTKLMILKQTLPLEHHSLELKQLDNCVDDILEIYSRTHGESYSTNSEFEFHEFIQDLNKKYRLVLQGNENVAGRLIGDIKMLERIFSRIALHQIRSVKFTILHQNDEEIQLQFTFDDQHSYKNDIETKLIAELITLIDAKATLEGFTVTFPLAEDHNFRVRRP